MRKNVYSALNTFLKPLIIEEYESLDKKEAIAHSKIINEYFSILLVLFFTYDAYRIIFEGHRSYSVLIIVGLIVYRDLRLCQEGMYFPSNNKLRISMSFVAIFVFFFMQFLYNILDISSNHYVSIIALILSIVIVPFFYKRIIYKLLSKASSRSL